MTTFDAHANLAIGYVSAGSSVIGSAVGVTLVAESDAVAAEFPAVPFNVTVWRDPAPLRPAAEIMRVVGFDGHRTFTVERAQEGTSALAGIGRDWRFANTITAGDVEAIEVALNGEEAARAAADADLQANIVAEAASRVAGDAATLSSAESYSASEVAAEAATRSSADATLQSHIDAEASARASGDASTLASAESYTDGEISAEASARVSGDAATLSSAETYADAAQAAAEAASDPVGTAAATVAAEAATRAAADALLIPLAEKGADNGVAELGADGRVPYAQLPGYVPSTGVAGTDSANLQAALDALPVTGGTILLDNGPYDLSAGVTISHPVRIVGLGPSSDNILADTTYFATGTKIVCTSRTVSPFTINADGCCLERLYVQNTASAAPTAGAGILVATGGKSTKILDCSVVGFYVDIDVRNGNAIHIERCTVADPVQDAISLQNLLIPDAGGHFISECWIDAGPTHLTPRAGIYWSSGGGVKVENNRIGADIAGMFSYGCLFEAQPGQSTAIAEFVGNTIEDMTIGVQVATIGTGTFSRLVIADNYIDTAGGPGGPVIVIAGADATHQVQHTSISGNVLNSGFRSAAVSLTNVAHLEIGPNEYADSAATVTFHGTNSSVEIGPGMAFATAGRPAASMMSAGARYFDQTLLKPIFADGVGGWVELAKMAQVGMQPIQTITLAVDAASIDFPAIPQTYNRLEIHLRGRTDDAALQRSAIDLRFNGDATAADYTNARLFAINGLGPQNDGNPGSMQSVFVPGDGADANVFGTARIWVGGYTDAGKKQALGLYGQVTKLAATVNYALGITALSWVNAAAVIEITLAPSTGGVKFRAGTVATLYGLRG